ncbi:hypothetical protein BpHYR1_006345 [Brachionus plicatilis]|uniref:Uncharacterized protein n=1 Tax=Brachionus plicatilis TaxID=10195 RepID=A0A3M7RI14_BRAPC|nr:hypothetical protein BpHYR1_006345 [Brachionus plicatilis]
MVSIFWQKMFAVSPSTTYGTANYSLSSIIHTKELQILHRNGKFYGWSAIAVASEIDKVVLLGANLMWRIVSAMLCLLPPWRPLNSVINSDHNLVPFIQMRGLHL